MRLKKLGAALVVAAAFGAILASSALAAAVTEDAHWYTSKENPLSGALEIEAEAIGTGTFTTTVSGTTYKLESTEVECVECKIENVGGVAVGSGKLKFRKITVAEPAGCSAPTEITSTALSVTADWMSAKETEPNYIKFVPTKGETTAFATIEITGCPAATSLVPKGSVFVQSANKTEVLANPQKVSSSKEINEAAGGTLHVGTEPAVLKAEANFKTKTGVTFGTQRGSGGAATEDVGWYVGKLPGTKLSGSETMSAEAAGTPTFATTVGETKYKIEATGIKCVECKIEIAGADAVGSGKLALTGAKVVEPAGCSVATEITTTALTWTGGWMISSNNYLRFVPTAGESTAFATIEITGCASATSLVPKGSLFVQSQNATDIQAVEQEMHSSEAINLAAGGTLKVGTKTAVLTGSAKFKMSGTHKGEEFGTH